MSFTWVPCSDPYLSIVIPARNDAPALAHTLRAVQRLRRLSDCEIVVAASGDRDSTLTAVGPTATVIWPLESTRAALMNEGARLARGLVLLFLHADTILPVDAVDRIQDALRDPQVPGGAFEHRFVESDWRLRAISGLNRIRCRLTHNFYGDQAIFVRRSIFAQLDGFRPLSLMEDLNFSQRMKKLGRSRLARAAIATSGRRFLDRGPWRTFGLCLWLLALWTVGVDVERYAAAWRGGAEEAPPTSPAVAPAFTRLGRSS